MSEKRIACSIVLYQTEWSVLEKCLKSVLSAKCVTMLYLIDHSPTPLFNEPFEDERIQYIFTNDNKGYGAGHNIALKKSLNKCVSYHLVLNPDVYFEGEILDEILDFALQHPKIGNLMPKVFYPDGRLQYLCKLLPTPYDWIGRRFNPIQSFVEKRNEIFELRFTGYKDIMEVPYLSGCFMFLNLSAIKKVGLFDENIFMYGEETDMCRRLIQAGYQTVFYPKVQIYHSFAKGSHKDRRLTKIGIQSAIYYFNKWGWLFDAERRKINRETLHKLGK